MVYLGSKFRLYKYLVPIIQFYIDKNNIETYIEPFVGGANIIDKIKCKYKYGYDIHAGLIGIFKATQEGWLPPLHITEEDYKLAKEGKIEEPLRSFIGFNASFGRKYFGGFGRCTDNKGNPRDYYNEGTRNYYNQIQSYNYLKDIIFDIKDYRELNPKNSMIYCDPPYQNTTDYSTCKIDYDEMWNIFRKWNENNIVLISEFNAPDDCETLWQMERKISTSSQKVKNGTKLRTEKLFKFKS